MWSHRCPKDDNEILELDNGYRPCPDCGIEAVWVHYCPEVKRNEIGVGALCIYCNCYRADGGRKK